MTPANDTSTILIIDDTPSNLGVVVTLLEGCGYRVSIAQDGAEGVQRAQLVLPDMILLDVMMPDMDGFEACRRLKAHAATRDIPVIFMTALASTEHKVAGFRAGAVDYVTKPLQIDEVIARVCTHLTLRAAQKRLEQQNAELARHREALELRVAERTAELAAREREFRTLAENAPDNIARHDRDCRYIYLNRQLETSLGASKETVLGKTPMELVSGSAAITGYQACMQEVMLSGQAREYEMVLPDQGDGPRYHSIRLVAERDASGEVVGVLALGRDITERRRVELQLHEREQALRAVVEHSPDTIVRYDRACHRIYLNPEMEKIFGRPVAQLLGTSPRESTPMPPDYLHAIQTVLETGQEARLQTSYRNAAGQLNWVDLRFAPEFGADGAVATVLAIGRDITDMKRAQDELKEREQRYHEIFDNAVEGMYLLEVTEDGRFRNIDINPALAASVGMSRESMIGKFVDETVSEEVARQTVEKYRRCVAADTTITESIELDLPAGKRYYISTITPIHYSGRIHRLIGISREITDLKRYERELEASRQQIRELSARRERAREDERKRIARELHDELGQMLTALRMDIMMLPTRFGLHVPGLEAKADKLTAQVDNTIQTVRDVVSMVRPSALDMGIGPALEWLAQEFSRYTGTYCDLDLPEGSLGLDEEHSLALFRIVQESLTNVARHARASEIQISLLAHGEEYRLEVRDNGVGFDPGEVADKKTFGLLGMRERVLVLGGSMKLLSKAGEGATMSVVFPKSQGDKLD